MASQYQPAFVWPPENILHPDAKRIEIDEFIVDDVLSNLFLLALSSMQKKNPPEIEDRGLDWSTDWWSYYNLSTIHGLPLELYRDVKNTMPTGQKNKDRASKGYYCAHASVVFPPWHRCQMHTLEQAIYRRMELIANRFQDAQSKEEHLAALKRYRLPYWDPVMPRLPYDPNISDEKTRVSNMFGVPRILSQKTIHVVDPTKGQTMIDNPLYTYELPSAQDFKDAGRVELNFINSMFNPRNDPRFKKQPWHDTFQARVIRAPKADGSNDDDYLTESFQSQGQLLSTALWQLLNPDESRNKTRSWENFSNHEFTQDIGVCLEAWHDQIHGLLGSARVEDRLGHMGSTASASYDPAFWLHHNNVERLFSIYQALYDPVGKSDQYFVSAKSPPGNEDKIPVKSSELSPFEREKGKSYTSEEVRDWTKDAYAIPGPEAKTPEGRRALQEYLKQTYYWATELSVPPKTLSHYTDIKKRELEHGSPFALDGGEFKSIVPVVYLTQTTHSIVRSEFKEPTAESAVEQEVVVSYDPRVDDAVLYPEGSFTDKANARMLTWNALIKVRKYAFQGSFNVQVFIGKNMVPPDSEARNYFTTPEQVGFSTIFAYRADADCANCRDNEDLIYADAIPLTPFLTNFLKDTRRAADIWPPPELRVLDSFEAEVEGGTGVIAFLTKHLEWRIVDLMGDVKTAEQVTESGLELVVADRTYDFPTADTPLGVYGPQTVRPEITRGKVGGAAT